MASSKTSSFDVMFQFPPAPSLLSTLSDEDSFVVLKKNDNNEVIEVVMDTDEVIFDNQSLQASSSVEMSSGEMQDKMLQIMDENTLLRARISENNKILTSQCENIMAWKEYQQQAKGEKELFEMLKGQNHALTDKLEEMKGKKEVLDNEIIILTQNLANLKKIFKVNEKDLEVSKKDIEELIQINSNFNDEFKQFKMNKDQEGNLLKQFQKENEELNKQNLSLVKELVRRKIRQTNQDEEVSAMKKNLITLNQNHDNNLRHLGRAEKQIAELKTKLRETKPPREQQKKVHLQMLGVNPTEEMMKIKEQLNNAKVVLMHLEQNKVVADGQIEALSNEILELRQKLQESQQQTDQIHALEAQLEMFKADFEAEKDMKRKITDENQKLSIEVETLRTHCQRLQEEVNALRSLQVASASRSEVFTNSAMSSNPSSTMECLRCPICNFEFNIEQELLNHVERCVHV